MSKTSIDKKALAIAFICSLIPMSGLTLLYYNSKATIKIKDNKVLSSEEQKILDQVESERIYQIQITSFDPAKYELPKSNPSFSNGLSKCTNGFGGKMNKIYDGMFNEPLYTLDAEKLETEILGGFAYSPYVKSYTLVGDILFLKPLDLFDRKLLTSLSLKRNFSDLTTIVGSREYKNSYATMESKFGFPQSYISQQSGMVVDFSVFNNQCEKNIGGKNVTFTRINLDGKPISLILAAQYKTTLQHGANGLYNFTTKQPMFVSENFLEWIQSNNRAYQHIINNTNKNYTFGPNSYVYIPQTYSSDTDVVRVDFKAQPLGVNLEELKKSIAQEYMISINEIMVVEEKLDGFTVLKFAKGFDLEPIDELAFAFKNGKIYPALWESPGVVNLDIPDATNGLVLMNENALGKTLEVFKSVYQGMSLDLSTDNKNQNIKHLNQVGNGGEIIEKFNKSLN